MVERRIPMDEAMQVIAGYMDRLRRDDRRPARAPIEIGRGRIVLTPGDDGGYVGFRVYHANHGQDERPGDLTALFHEATGGLEAVYAGDDLGAWRTGALGGLAIRALAPRPARRIGVLGCGRQARTQLIAASYALDFEEARVFCRDATRRRRFAVETQSRTGRPIIPVDSARHAVDGAAVVICATSSATPVFEMAWLEREVHVNHVGPKWKDACDVPAQVYDDAALIVTDSSAQVAASWDRLVPEATRGARWLPELLDEPDGRPCRGRSVFLSLGLAGTEIALLRALLARIEPEELQ
jgi:ornithine cyclodeaminase